MARWLVLTTRCGNEIENPSPQDLRQAVTELAHDDPAEHHPSTWLRSESEDDGPSYLVTVHRDGDVSFAEFESDADDPVVELTKKVCPEKALELLTCLAEGKLDLIKQTLADP